MFAPAKDRPPQPARTPGAGLRRWRMRPCNAPIPPPNVATPWLKPESGSRWRGSSAVEATLRTRCSAAKRRSGGGRCREGAAAELDGAAAGVSLWS